MKLEVSTLPLLYLYATATGLAALFDGELSHDQLSRYLRAGDWGSKDLWSYIKDDVRRHEQKLEMLCQKRTQTYTAAICTTPQD